MSVRLVAGLLLCAAVSACAAPDSLVQPATAFLQATPGGDCQYELAGQSYTEPNAKAIERPLAELRKSTDKLTIEAPARLPYKCVGGFLFYARKAGFTEIRTLSAKR